MAAPTPVILNRRTALRSDKPNGTATPRIIPTVRPRAATAEVVKPLPRRMPLLAEGSEFNSPREVRFKREVSSATPFILVRRLWAWSIFFLRLFFGHTWDAVTRRSTPKRQAVRLRLLLEALGTTAIKIGQLLTVNAYNMPVEYADELEKLFDSVPAMPPDQAIELIEKAQGRPLRDMFARFDPTPVAGGAIACVYQAVLLTGERVAVKVRRPGIERSFRTDFVVLRLLHSVGEFLGVARSAQTGAILTECQRMLTDEMDLRLEARQIEVYRNATKDRIEFITAPQVFHSFTCPQMLVTEFVEGVTIRELLNALKKNNAAHLAQLTQLGYDFRKISKRLLHLFYWQTFEAMVFHADLSPANIIVTPDLRLTLVDFGCCGTIPPKYRRNIYGFMKSVESGDLAGAVRNVIGLSEPLPPIDVQKFTFDMTGIMREYLVNVRSEHVPWQEKCNLSGFRQAMLLARRYGVPVRPELLRYFRSVRHLDYMVYRLNPKVDLSKQFRKYFQKRAQVARREARRAFKDTVSILYDNFSVDGASIARSALTGMARLQDLVDSGGFQFGTALQKLPYVFSTIMTTVFRAVVIVMAIAGIKTIHWEFTHPEDHVLDYWDHLFSVSHSYTIEALLVFFGLISLAKIVKRLRQADVDK